MDFLPAFDATIAPIPTSTISVSPPGGTHHHHGHHKGPANPPYIPAFLIATKRGHNALWVVFVLFLLGFIATGFMALRVEKKARLFHWLSISVLGCAMLSYFAMANDMGISYIAGHARGVYYARYIDWLFTTPLLLVSLAFLAGLSPADSMLLILADIGMIVTGLFSAVTPGVGYMHDRTKWGWFAISCVSFLMIWFVLLTGGMKAAALRPQKTKGLFVLLSIMTLVLWTAYPIVAGIAEGVDSFTVDSEIIAYGVLDVAAKLGFTFILLAVHTHGDDDTYTLPEWFVTARVGQGSDGRGGYGAVRGDDD